MHMYYVVEEMFSSQINTENVVGYKGHLVFAFAGIMQQMWKSD